VQHLQYLKIIQVSIHYGLHLLLPFAIAKIFYKQQWYKAYLLLLATMLVDLDHLFANPIFDPNRCSIGFHPLHSYVAIGCYILLLFVQHTITRIIAIGLVLHMCTDWQDCKWQRYIMATTHKAIVCSCKP
jgi:hypothetical protein